mgnify:CR=1 FL=1
MTNSEEQILLGRIEKLEEDIVRQWLHEANRKKEKPSYVMELEERIERLEKEVYGGRKVGARIQGSK